MVSEQLGVKDHGLGSGRLQGDHAAASNLASGSCGRRNGDEGWEARPCFFIKLLAVLQSKTRVFNEQPAYLGDIQCAASSKANDAIAGPSSEGFSRTTHIGFDRIGMYFMEQCHVLHQSCLL